MFLHQLTIFLIAIFLSFPIYADENKDAMFGLQWGMTPDDITKLGVSMIKEKGDKNLQNYETTSLPKNISDIEKYTLIFSDDKLVKIQSRFSNITEDPTGRIGKEKFEVISKSLQEKYGSPTHNSQFVGKKLFKDYDEFYQCLNYAGCGLWFVGYKTPTKSIALELNGLRRGVGYILLVVEAEPEWSNALDKYKSLKNKSDKDAL